MPEHKAFTQTEKPVDTQFHDRKFIKAEYRKKCRQLRRKQPPTYLVNCVQDQTVVLPVDILAQQDLPFVEVLLNFPIHCVTIMSQEIQNSKSRQLVKGKQSVQKNLGLLGNLVLRELLRLVNRLIEKSESIRSLKIESVSITLELMKEIVVGLTNSEYLKELYITKCNIGDQHLEVIKESLIANKSLVWLNLSHNRLTDIGSRIGKICSEHARRRNQMVWVANIRGERPSEEIQRKGLCEVNLESNQIHDRAVYDMIQFLKDDNWLQCLNLKRNCITEGGISQFIDLMKTNTSLIVLDLRENEGFTKEYSKQIFHKSFLNLQRYKKIKNKTKGNYSPEKLLFDSAKKSRKKQLQQAKQQVNLPDSSSKAIRYDSSLHNEEHNVRDYVGMPRQQLNGNSLSNMRSNLTIVDDIHRGDPSGNHTNIVNVNQQTAKQPKCVHCKQMTFKLLKLQKKNLDLQLQMRRLKQAFVSKNIQISSIILNQQASEQCSYRNVSEDELLLRMEQIMMELTKIMETVEDRQHTNINLSNPLLENDNANSLQNTIPLYKDQDQLLELSREISHRLNQEEPEQEDYDRRQLEDGISKGEH